MVRVYSIDGITPVVHPAAFVHPSATLIGDVIVGPGAYIAPSASLRGDFGRIVVEEGANLQDCCIVHGFPDEDTVIERDAHIGEWAMVAALAFVKAGMKVPARTLVAGIPARPVRELTDDELAWKADATRQYQELAVRCLNTMQEAVALTEVEPDRKRLALGTVLPLSEWKARRS